MLHKDLIEGLMNMMNYLHLGSVNQLAWKRCHRFVWRVKNSFVFCFLNKGFYNFCCGLLCNMLDCCHRGTVQGEAGIITFTSLTWRRLRGVSLSPRLAQDAAQHTFKGVWKNYAEVFSRYQVWHSSFLYGLTQGNRPLPRAAHACATVGNRGYVFGGRYKVRKWI